MDVDVDDDSILEITVPHGTLVSGFVFDEHGQPLGDVSIGVKRTSVAQADVQRAPYATTRSDDAGKFVVGLGGDGDDCMVDARLPGHAPSRVGCGLVQGIQSEPVEVTLRGVAAVRGLVSFGPAIGGPANNADIELLGLDDALTTKAGRGGAYLLSDVPPGSYQLCARLEELSTCAPIDVGNGETVERDLDFACSSTHVSGRVTDASGAPVEDAELEVSTTLSREVLVWSATMSDGRFELRDLPDCVDLRFTVVRGGHRTAIEIPAGATIADLELPAVASLDLSLGCEPQASLGGAVQVEVQRPSGVFPLAQTTLYGRERTARFTGLPRTTLLLRSRSGGRSTEIRVDLEAVDHAELPCPE